MKKALFLMLAICIISIEPASAIGKKKLKKIMNSWKGATTQQLYAQLGPPTRVTSDGKDGKILTYTDKIFMPGTAYLPPEYMYEHKMFYVDKWGVIYSWRWERNNMPPQQSDVNINVNVSNGNNHE